MLTIGKKKWLEAYGIILCLVIQNLLKIVTISNFVKFDKLIKLLMPIYENINQVEIDREIGKS